jgi:hypothetical protein
MLKESFSDDQKILNEYSIVPNKEDLQKWQDLKFNLGVIGDASQLKNKFLNRLAGIGFDNEIDSNQKSSDSQIAFKTHSFNSSFFLWDLNTAEKSKSFDQDLGKYDVFVLFREADFTQDDFSLVKEFENLNKKVYLVKFEDIKTEPESKNVSEVNKNKNIYIFTSVDYKDSLSKLYLDIFQNLPDEEKKQAFMFSIEPISHEIIQSKSRLLAKRTHNVALVSTLFGKLVSLPGLSLIADFVLISSEIWFYKDQLGLSKRNLEEMKKKGKDFMEKVTNLMSNSKYGSYLVLHDIRSLTELLIKSLPILTNLHLVDWITIVPIIGSAMHNSASFSTTKYTLVSILEEFEKVANDLQSLVYDQKRIEQAVQSNDEARFSIKEMSTESNDKNS